MPFTNAKAPVDRLAGFLRLAEQGYHLVPVTIRRTEVATKTGTKIVKRPEFHAGWRDPVPTVDPLVIRDWYAQHDPATVSFAICHGPSGTEAGDLDPKDGGPESWTQLGLPASTDQVLTPSGGVHLYWRRVGEGIGTNAGKIGRGIDARSVGGVTFAPGSVVVGLNGTVEPVGYTGDLPKVADLDPTPTAVVEAFAVHQRAARATGGAITRHDTNWALAKAREQCDVVGSHDPRTMTGFRNKLIGAGMLIGRLVDGGLVTTAAATDRLLREVRKVYPEPDDDDIEWIRRGLVDGPARERWEISDPPERPAEVLPEPSEHDRAVERELAKLRAQHEARRLLARELTAHRPTIAGGILDDLAEVDPPTMLLGSLIPDLGVGFLAGRSGAYKSFLAVGWACSVATGRAWLDDPQFAVARPLKTLYVAAEGKAGVAARVRAWEARTGVSRAGALHIYPRPIHLTDPAQVDELAEVVREGGYGFLVIDTYHRSAPNAEENSSTEFGPVFEAACRLRDDHGCGVLFVDHTGHDGARLRGTSAKGDNADYWHLASYAGDSRGREVQRTLTVRKLKDDESDQSWPVRLDHTSPMPVVEVGMNDSPFAVFDAGQWWTHLAELPAALGSLRVQQAMGGSARGVETARDVFRLLSYVGLNVAVTDAELTQAFANRADGGPHHSKTSVKRARSILLAIGLAVDAARGTGIELASL